MNYTKGEWDAWRFSRLHNWKVSLGEDGDYIDCGQGKHSEANAQLIAAAPEMYEALKELRDAVISYHGSDFLADSVYQPLTNALEQVRQALAKAEGIG